MKRSREMTTETLNTLAPRLLDIAAARDQQTAHTEKFEGDEEQMLLLLRYYTLGRLGRVPNEWMPHLERLEQEEREPGLALLALLAARFPQAVSAPDRGARAAWAVPKPTVKHLHSELATTDFPWVDHEALRTRRHRTQREQRAGRVAAQLCAADASLDPDQEAEDAPPPPAPTPASTAAQKRARRANATHGLDDVRRQTSPLTHSNGNGTLIADDASAGSAT
jgi:hypothetical protein